MTLYVSENSESTLLEQFYCPAEMFDKGILYRADRMSEVTLSMAQYRESADLRLDRIIHFFRIGPVGSMRTHLDEWAAYFYGGGLLTRGCRQRWFNNPCPWKEAQRLFDHMDWITPAAAAILKRGLMRDLAVKKTKGGISSPFRLIVDHAVPVKVLRDTIGANPALWYREPLEKFLCQHFRRGVLTIDEDARLSSRYSGNQWSLKARMPSGWKLGSDPFARYTAIGLKNVKEAENHCSS
ncbi:hypothetical protein EIK56_24855 [Sphingomonas sp. C8-2]|nr:hypothetical protein EIK56_24855 [Sphingomonas sp. C8-2]